VPGHRLQEHFLLGTAHEYIWLDRAPPPLPAAAVVTADTAVVPGMNLGGEVEAARKAAPGQEAEGRSAEPDVNARWVMEDEQETKGSGLWKPISYRLIAQCIDSQSTSDFAVLPCLQEHMLCVGATDAMVTAQPPGLACTFNLLGCAQSMCVCNAAATHYCEARCAGQSPWFALSVVVASILRLCAVLSASSSPFHSQKALFDRRYAAWSSNMCCCSMVPVRQGCTLNFFRREGAIKLGVGA
jgi:hypothetical protein